MTDHLRPRAHFTAKTTWLNDPNGLLYHGGFYHLFYQSNPHGSSWGNISWGHARSTDLLSWEDLGIAIPFENGEAVFSGSAVVDERNTAGFAAEGETALVAIYTAHREGNQSQALAFSLDGGLTWERYEGNPVLDVGSSEFRDPKVFWYGGDDGHWVMAVVEAVERRVEIYTSDDLKEWSYASSFGPAHAVDGSWECPDLFPLQLSGEGEKWVMLVSLNRGGIAGGSGTQYFVGDFDGRSFRAEELTSSEELQDFDWFDRGPDSYATVTFNNEPSGRRLAVGWASNWLYATKTPTAPWRGAMTLVRELTLERTGEGELKLRQRPILPADEATVLKKRFSIPREREALISLRSAAGDLFTVTVAEGLISCDRSLAGDSGFSKNFTKRWSAPLPPGEAPHKLLLVADGSVIEIFVAGGRLTLVAQAFPKAPWESITARPL